MRDRSRMVGYNRTVKLCWLDKTVDLLLSGHNDLEIAEYFRDQLRDQLSPGSDAKRGSREKTITILLKTWVRVPAGEVELRDDALAWLRKMKRAERFPLHWGMTMAAYPFWRLVADVTGRLFRLQGTASAQQVQRRVKELLGEREAVARSARYVLRAFVDWGVIMETESKGTYTAAQPMRITDVGIASWLLDATLVASEGRSVDFKRLLSSPALFPFHLPRVAPERLGRSGRLDLVRQALDHVLVVQR